MISCTVLKIIKTKIEEGFAFFMDGRCRLERVHAGHFSLYAHCCSRRVRYFSYCVVASAVWAVIAAVCVVTASAWSVAAFVWYSASTMWAVACSMWDIYAFP